MSLHDCRKKFQEPITMQLFGAFAEGLKKEKAKENLPGNLGYVLSQAERTAVFSCSNAICVQQW